MVGKGRADHIYETLPENGVDVLYDDRDKISAGVKFSESDLIGIPTRMVVSPRSLSARGVEMKDRKSGAVEQIGLDQLPERFHAGIKQ